MDFSVAKQTVWNFAFRLTLVTGFFFASMPAIAQESGELILEALLQKEIQQLKSDLSTHFPVEGDGEKQKSKSFVSNGDHDVQLVKYSVMKSATAKGLASFAVKSKSNQELINQLLGNHQLMKRMLVADGAKTVKQKRILGPAQYGPAMKIYSKIGKARTRSFAKWPVLDRLALAISLEHSVPVAQTNPKSNTLAPKFVDPVKRYLHFEKAFLQGELDPAFGSLTTWELRYVVNGDEPDEVLAWGRRMLRNIRPDHILISNAGWRYVKMVATDVKYGSENVKNDRPDLQKYQNILLNGGVCGRRAFFGRFILRSFGIPTIARPSRGHGALAHWTPNGWVVNLGGGWGVGWTKTRYKKDLDFLATTQARTNPTKFLMVKRARWVGDVMGEKRIYSESEPNAGYWNKLALKIRGEIIENSKSTPLKALGEDLGEANEPTVAQKISKSPISKKDRKVAYLTDGSIRIPSAAYHSPKGNSRDVVTMKSFDSGLQAFLPRFFPQGKTVLRGGTWKGDPNNCTSGKRLLSGGYGKYNNWGLRVAVATSSNSPTKKLSLKINSDTNLDLVLISPGEFVMGGESKKDGRFQCVELPKHSVHITKHYYLGKFEVTQKQYLAVMGTNPSRSTKRPDGPVDNISEKDAHAFCRKLSELTGHDCRLPTEAEWEYACRAGSEDKWFFGNDSSRLGEFAWYKENAGGKSHPVGQKDPNPWGLYDIYGNVCERISDKYSRNYYSISPKVDPKGPSQGTKSHIHYKVDIPKTGVYQLTTKVVTSNSNQRLNFQVNGSNEVTVVDLPFTLGAWQYSKPVTVNLTKGENTLHMWRNNPPQFGIALKHLILKPVK